MSRTQEAFAAAIEGSRSTEPAVPTGQLSVKVSGTDTGGAFAVFEVPTVPFAGPPLHLHHTENEWFYVLGVEHDFQVGDKIYHLAPGGNIFAPRMMPHTWQNVGDSPGRMLVFVQPAGRLEAFFALFSKLVSVGALSRAATRALLKNTTWMWLGHLWPRHVPGKKSWALSHLSTRALGVKGGAERQRIQ